MSNANHNTKEHKKKKDEQREPQHKGKQKLKR